MKKKPFNHHTTPQHVSLGGILLLIMIVGLAIFSSYTLFLIIFGMLPGIIAYIIDRFPTRYLTRIVLLFNLSGLVRYLVVILSTPEKAQEIATKFILNPVTWLYIYLYSAIGWIIYWSFPNINMMLQNLFTQLKTNNLNDELDALVEEWGKEVKKNSED